MSFLGGLLCLFKISCKIEFAGMGVGERGHLRRCNVPITAFQQTHLNNVCYFSVMRSLLPEDFPLQFISQ